MQYPGVSFHSQYKYPNNNIIPTPEFKSLTGQEVHYNNESDHITICVHLLCLHEGHRTVSHSLTTRPPPAPEALNDKPPMENADLEVEQQGDMPEPGDSDMEA